MKQYIEQRVKILADYIIENNATVRSAAKHFNVSKSTVHKDVKTRLYALNRGLYKRVVAVLEKNKSERHLRGGKATKEKYSEMRKKNKIA